MANQNENYNTDSGYSNSDRGYETSNYSSDKSNAYGQGNNPWQTDYISDGYRENIFEVNFQDTPYTETLSNPNPQSGYSYRDSNSEDLEL